MTSSRITLVAALLLIGAGAAHAADYNVTTTATSISVSDAAGNGDVLDVAVTSTDITFSVAGRTFSVNGGADLNDSSGPLSLSGITSITIDAAAGGDAVIMSSAGSVILPSFTVNGGEGDDEVQFDTGTYDIATLDVDLQNDAGSPGLDDVVLAASAVVRSTTGTITIRCSRSLFLDASSVLETGNSALVIEANQQFTPAPGDYAGVFVNGGRIEATGAGAVTIMARGGDAVVAGQAGVLVLAAGEIVGGSSGPVIVNGTGGASPANSAAGVAIVGAGSSIRSNGGNIVITGVAGGTGASASSRGVQVTAGALVAAGGGGSVTLTGSGSPSAGNFGQGVLVSGAGSRVFAPGGILIVGNGGGSGSDNEGIEVSIGAEIESSGSVKLEGTSGDGVAAGHFGVLLSGVNTLVRATGLDDLEITGTGGNTNGTTGSVSTMGVFAETSPLIEATGGGAIIIRGNAGSTTQASSEGCRLTNQAIVSGNGPISITCVGGFSPGTAGFVGSLGANIRNNSLVTSTADGAITIEGTGGETTQGASQGARVDLSVVSNTSGPINISGLGGLSSTSSSLGLFVANSAQVATAGSGTITLAGTGGDASLSSSAGFRIDPALVTSVDGAISITGNSVNCANNALGASIRGDVVATGSGAISITGTSAAVTGATPAHGVNVRQNPAATSGGVVRSNDGNITITGIGGSGTADNAGFNLASVQTGVVEAIGSGSIRIRANGINIHPSNGTIAAAGDDVTLEPLSNGTDINVGSALGPVPARASRLMTPSHSTPRSTAVNLARPEVADVAAPAEDALAITGDASPGGTIRTDAAGLLELSDAELDRVTAGRLEIGNATSGTITVSAAITRSLTTVMALRSGQDIVFVPGSVNTAGGLLLLAPGASGQVRPVTAGVEATTGAGAAVTLGSGGLGITIDGTTVDIQYDQLNVAGDVNLANAKLSVGTGTAYLPSAGQTYTIVNNDGADPIVGTFENLDEGDFVSADFLGSGNAAQMSYVGGDGNDCVITVLNGATGVTPEAQVAFALDGVRPNPARATNFNVTFALPSAAAARLELVDISGRKVADREVGSLGAGRHSVNLLAGRSVAPGLYWVRLIQGVNRRAAQVVVVE